MSNPMFMHELHPSALPQPLPTPMPSYSPRGVNVAWMRGESHINPDVFIDQRTGWRQDMDSLNVLQRPTPASYDFLDSGKSSGASNSFDSVAAFLESYRSKKKEPWEYLLPK